VSWCLRGNLFAHKGTKTRREETQDIKGKNKKLQKTFWDFLLAEKPMAILNSILNRYLDLYNKSQQRLDIVKDSLQFPAIVQIQMN